MAAAQFENDGRLQDAIDAFVGKAGTAGRELRLPAGRYHMNVPLTFNGINGLVVNAHGVELFGHAPNQHIVVLTNCQNVTLSGLSVDWDPEHLPFTQGTITALDDNRRRVTVRLHRGYSRQCDPKAGHTVIVAARTERIAERDVRMVRSETRWDWSIEDQRGDVVVLRKDGPRDASNDEEQIGDYIVIPTTDVDPRTNRTHAVVTRGCQHVVMRDVTVYASGCFAFFDEFCEATTFDRCRVIPRPLASELVEREVERLSSSSADAIHSKDARQGVVVTNCHFFCHRDDGVAIHGTYFFVLKSWRENGIIDLLVPDLDHFNAVMHVGAHLDALDVSGARRSRNAVVTGFTTEENVGAINIEPALQAWNKAGKPQMDAKKLSDLQGCTRWVRLQMSEHVDLAAGSLVAVESRLGHDFSVRFCEFGPSRARGALAKASRGRINNNTFIGQRHSAVLVCPEFWWQEAGCADDIEIHGNTIHRCHDIPIHVHATAAHGGDLPAGVFVHNDIRVTRNTIRDCAAAWADIRVTSTAGVVVARNGAGVRTEIEHCIGVVSAD